MDLASALGPAHGDERPWCTAQLLAVDNTTNRAQVSIDGGEAVWLPFVSNSYTGITTVFVLRDPQRSGAGQLVIGPCGTQPADAVPPPPPPAPDPSTPSTVTSTALIRPTWSGTYRSIRGTWDRWNTDRYGGRSTLYQGDAYGSGPLMGLAVYGDQVKNLRALSIAKVSLSVTLATGSGTVVVQGSPSGVKPSGAPSSSGSTASRSGSGSIPLPADVCEAFRTGATKGLALVGTDYLGVRGTSLASGMALSITYTRAA